jgi:hypothetical protein
MIERVIAENVRILWLCRFLGTKVFMVCTNSAVFVQDMGFAMIGISCQFEMDSLTRGCSKRGQTVPQRTRNGPLAD